MLFEPAYWCGVITGFFGLFALGLALGAITFSGSISRDGVKTEIKREP